MRHAYRVSIVIVLVAVSWLIGCVSMHGTLMADGEATERAPQIADAEESTTQAVSGSFLDPLSMWASLGITQGAATNGSFPLLAHAEFGLGATGVRAYVPITRPAGYLRRGAGMEFIHYFQLLAYKMHNYVVPFCGGGFWQGGTWKGVELSASAFAGVRLRPSDWLEFHLQLRGFLGNRSQGLALEAGVLFTLNRAIPVGI